MENPSTGRATPTLHTAMDVERELREEIQRYHSLAGRAHRATGTVLQFALAGGIVLAAWYYLHISTPSTSRNATEQFIDVGGLLPPNTDPVKLVDQVVKPSFAEAAVKAYKASR